MNNSTKKIDVEPKMPPWFTVTTVNSDKVEAVYENVTDYSLGGGYLGMKFKDGSASYVSLELHFIADIDVETHE